MPEKKRMMFSSTVKDHVTSSETFTAAVITVSDSCARGERVDMSGPAVSQVLQKSGFNVAVHEIVSDDSMQIQNVVVRLALAARLIVTTGGTGVGPRDVTPEATRAVCERVIDGVGERMRAEGVKKTPLAALSRGLCGVRGKSVILNLPGSPSGAVESLQAVIELIPHALQLLEGNTAH
jgi:molybdopterin adenylyltransferase